ncbi:MAG TPA: AmmeMemoRadiSam system protein B [Thermoanaerobaculia bacterium]|jgi:AmmeMemoRadiSam system protein B|nr:AmmeMemoRadiSam system protein B [Thermoanaerobaculia bacterium]
MAARLPAVAGQFYDALPERLERDVRVLLPVGNAPEPAFGAIVPHAGYVYSGAVAGAVYGRLSIPATCILLGPNHTGRGAPAALEPSEAWRTPLGDVTLNRRIADRLLALAPSLEEDVAAHRREHSLEVQLPFLQILRPDVQIVPVCLGEPSLALCREVGEALGRLRAEEAEPPLLIASSDMNHYESREIGRRKDGRALARVEALDPEGLFRTVLTESISMCGFLPATALLFAARVSGAGRARVVARADSGDQTGDTASVVGYAGMVIG